jgi:hypothetical protein
MPLQHKGFGFFRSPYRADLELCRGGSQGESLKDGEPQGRGLRRRQLLHQLLQGGLGEGGEG